MPAPLPRRFRRRLLGALLAAGLLPLLALGALGNLLLDRALSVSPQRLEEALRRAEAALATSGAAPSLRDELRTAELSLAQAELARQSLLKWLPLALGAALLLVALALTALSAALGRALARPVAQLTAEMAQVASGDLDLPEASLAHADSDELQFLLLRLREMAGTLAEQRQRLQITQGLAAWREVARALAHELSNPLTAMHMALARLSRVGASRTSPEDGERLREATALIADELAVLLRLTQSFAAFAKLPAPVLRGVDLSALLSEVCALYRAQGPVEVALSAPASLPLEADPDQLRRALGNLVKNALEASQAGDGPVLVAASQEGARARVTVTDAGQGIGRELGGPELARSLGSQKARGSGLGLPIAHKILHEHGGSLRLLPLPGRGTQAVIELPLRGDR